MTRISNESDMSNESCYKFSDEQFDLVFRMNVSMDSLGILVCLAVLALIVLSKAYKHSVNCTCNCNLCHCLVKIH